MRKTEKVTFAGVKERLQFVAPLLQSILRSQSGAACGRNMQFLILVRYIMVSTTKTLTFCLTDINGPVGYVDK